MLIKGKINIIERTYAYICICSLCMFEIRIPMSIYVHVYMFVHHAFIMRTILWQPLHIHQLLSYRLDEICYTYMPEIIIFKYLFSNDLYIQTYIHVGVHKLTWGYLSQTYICIHTYIYICREHIYMHTHICT